MDEAMKKIRDELAEKYSETTIGPRGALLGHMCDYDKMVFKAGFDAAMERTKILEEALEWISEDFPMSHTNNVVSKAKSALASFRGEK